MEQTNQRVVVRNQHNELVGVHPVVVDENDDLSSTGTWEHDGIKEQVKRIRLLVNMWEQVETPAWTGS